MKRQTWKQRLRPLAELIEQANTHCESLSDAELKKAIAACEKPTQVNCGWSTYHAAVIFRPMLLSESARRMYSKQKAAKK
jgi:hypothetical protein